MKEIVVITGASRGLGKELAREMLNESGYNLCLIARNSKDLEETKRELLNQFSGEILTFAGDISDEKFVREVFRNLKEKEFNVSYLINNAGVGRFCKVEENTRKIIDEVLSASLIGTILVTSNALPLMTKTGTIATIMSTAGLQGNACETAYCSAKWGERGFMEALKKELSSTSLKLVSIYPGGIDTTFWKNNRHYVSEEKSNGFMNPKELAKVIVNSLLSKPSLFVRELIIERLK